MSDPIRDKALKYLRAHNVLSLATAGPQGLWAAAVFYVNEGLDLFFLSSPTSRHALNIAANPQAAGTIQEDYEDWPDIMGVQLEGRAQRISGVEQARALARYAVKYPLVRRDAQTPAAIADALRRVAWYRLTPDRLYLIDNSQGFGHRDEVIPGG